jgi:hypothetical protein
MPQVTHSLSDKVTWRSALSIIDRDSPTLSAITDVNLDDGIFWCPQEGLNPYDLLEFADFKF